MSAILSADDLNDFISPGVACIKPIETLPPAPPDRDTEDGVVIDGQQQPANHAPAQISLTDCLACSGCVTSAEAILVSLQSHAEVLATLDAAPALRVVGPDAATGRFHVEGLEDEGAKLFVASVSPQTRANLAAACGRGVTERQAGYMLENMLRSSSGGKWNNAFTWVVDTNTARMATLELGADEVLSGPKPGVAAPSQPVLASSCPGWVCYAEKTHPYVLPHLSRVKSPQAMMGTMLKTTLSRSLNIPPSRIWHLAVMPCFDKKLEASREELTDEVWAGSGQPGRGVRDVDCVITSKEVLMLAESRGLDFFNLDKDIPWPPQQRFPDETMHGFLFPRDPVHNPPRVAGPSGGLLHHILQRKAAQTPGSEIQIAKGRNADVVEYTVTVGGEPVPVFKAARYYGFRNIQNLVRRLKPARPSRMPNGNGNNNNNNAAAARRPLVRKTAALEYGFVEVMACPGGCTNGGGQIKVDDPVVIERKKLPAKPDLHDQRDWLAEIDEAYFSGDEVQATAAAAAALSIDTSPGKGMSSGDDRSYVHDVLGYWSEMTGIGLDRLAFTTYREVSGGVGTEGPDGVAQLAGKIGGGW